MHDLDATRPSSLATLGGFDAEFRREADCPVAVFDFDGVLCGPVEDRVYKLPETQGEYQAMARVARDYGLDPELFDVPYLRHLLLQAILEERGKIPEPGPLLGLAQQLSRAGRPFFILTARSGQAAIKRALSFIEYHKVKPQEMFCVGRVAKGRQLRRVRKTVATRIPIVYFDDSRYHIKNSVDQAIDGLNTVRVIWPNVDDEAARQLWTLCLDAAEARNVSKRAA